MRINAIGHSRMDADLDAVVRPGLEGLVLPKVETAEEVMKVDAILTQREPKQKMPAGGVKLLVAIESPRGLLNASGIAGRSARVCGLMFGAEDFGRELGLPTLREGEARDMLYARSAMVIAAASAHVQAVDGVWVDLKDTEGLAAYGAAIAPSRLLGHVIDSPVADRSHQSDVQPDSPRKSTTLKESSRHSKRPMHEAMAPLLSAASLSIDRSSNAHGAPLNWPSHSGFLDSISCQNRLSKTKM